MNEAKTAPVPEMEHLLSELREYLDRHRQAPPESQTSGVRFCLREDGLEPPEAPARINPDHLGPFTDYLTDNHIVYDESNIRDLYLQWELKNGIRKSFGSEVSRMVDWRFAKPSDFYNSVGIDKRTFHKIKTDYGYRPSRKTALQCCIGLHLDAGDAENLLKLAGYALSPTEPMDLIIRFCLEKGIRNISTINYLLSSFDLEDLDE